jgi:hypothetical protein
MIMTKETEEIGEKLVPFPLYPPQIPHGLICEQTRASAVRSQRLAGHVSNRCRMFLRANTFCIEYSQIIYNMTVLALWRRFTGSLAFLQSCAEF